MNIQEHIARMKDGKMKKEELRKEITWELLE